MSTYKNNTIALAAVACLAACNAVAAEEEEKSPWTSAAELGYLQTSGNTNTTSLIFKFDIGYEIEKWKHAFHAETLKTETDDVTEAEKSLATYQTNYKINKRNYVFGLLSYEDDKFSGFEYQAKANAGYGHILPIREDMKLNVEIGPGHRRFKPDNSPVEDENLGRVAAKYLWDISKTSKFNQDLVAEYGEKQDEWKSVTALTAKINSALAMKLSHTVKYLDVVPAGNDNYDRETAVTLVYSF